jgi:hypothetical protein
MKSIYADLVDDVVSSYDQTKTTIQGRVASKTINSQTVLGPPLNKFIDIQTDTGIAAIAVFVTSNNRMFALGAVTAGVMPVYCYSFNTATGAHAYVGRINMLLPNTAATTHTIRAFKVKDTGTTGWQIFVATSGSVTINGGLFEAYNIALADFVPVGFPTIPFATGNGQKAVYFHQDPANVGVGQLQIATAGAVQDITNSKIYCHNGIAATHQYYVYDTAIVPTYVTNAVTGVAATDVITDTGHAYVANTPIVFTALTGGAGLTVGTVYFVRNPVAGVSYELSATSGGALLNFTTDISAGTVGRAFGTSTSNFIHKTGNLPALTGTLLLTDSEDYAVPTGVNVSVDTLGCAFFGTTSAMYLGTLAELTSGAVTWPSLQTCNLLGSANQITAATATHMAWSTVLNRAVYATNTAVFVMKQFLNNSIDSIFGGVNNRYLEALVANDVVEFQLAAMTSMDLEQGWLAVGSSATVGQRGIYLTDIRSDALFDYSYIVTKVLDTPQSVYKFITTLDQLYDYTGSLDVYYRTSGFGSISGGWLSIPFAETLDGITTPGAQVQFKIGFTTLGLDTSIPAQLNEFILGFESVNENSDNWQISKDLSSTGATHKVVYYLAKAYASTVPTLYTRAFQQLTTTSVGSANTSSNPSQYRYSTNGGTSWTALGTIPNTVGTLVEWTITPSPTVDYLPSIRES